MSAQVIRRHRMGGGLDPPDLKPRYIILTLAFRQEGKVWTGECYELGTATFGRTLRQTHDELMELVQLHLNSLEQVGERQRFFQEHGIKFYQTAPTTVTQPVPVDKETYVHAHRVLVGAGT